MRTATLRSVPGVAYRNKLVWLGVKERFRRLKRAWKYATGSLTLLEARELTYDIRSRAEQWSLSTITTQNVQDHAYDIWYQHPDLDRLIKHATQRVAGNWDAQVSSEVPAVIEEVLALVKEMSEEQRVHLYRRAW